MSNIDIWYIPFTTSDHHDLQIILNDTESSLANRFINDLDKKNYIQAHAYLRKILTHYFPTIKPIEWTFDKKSFGKPFITSSLPYNFYFNLAHCSSCAYVICSLHEKCGIDVEDVKKIDLDEDMLEYILTKEEKSYLEDKELSLPLFYTFWTLKEAHLKASGEGLSANPNQIDFSSNLTSDTNYHFISNAQTHYWTHNFKDKVILSYAIIDAKDTDIETRFFSINELA